MLRQVKYQGEQLMSSKVNNADMKQVKEVVHDWFWNSSDRNLDELANIIVDLYSKPTKRKWKNISRREIPKNSSEEFNIGANWAARLLRERNA